LYCAATCRLLKKVGESCASNGQCAESQRYKCVNALCVAKVTHVIGGINDANKDDGMIGVYAGIAVFFLVMLGVGAFILHRRQAASSGGQVGSITLASVYLLPIKHSLSLLYSSLSLLGSITLASVKYFSHLR
jgi:hypothetical protein